jgi:DNA-binding GntR family transcriptional regulator
MAKREGMGTSKKDLKGDFPQLVKKLENMILTGVFQPRERLTEVNLAEAFNVSRFWIRDALKILKTKGVVNVIPYKGAVVSDLDSREIEEIFQVRIVLEKLATRLATQHMKASDISVLTRMAKRVQESYEQLDFEAMISSNANFHDYIFKLSENQTLVQMIDQLRARCHILRHTSWSSEQIVRSILEEHKSFITALEIQDLELLDELAERHICHARDFYLLQLETKRALTAVASEA